MLVFSGIFLISYLQWKTLISDDHFLFFYINRPKAQLIDGKKIAKTIKDEVKVEVERMLAAGKRAPHLTAIQVGDDPASATYIKNKMKATETVGTNVNYSNQLYGLYID